MPSWEYLKIVDPQESDALTADYGSGSNGGWISESIDVKNIDEIVLELDITKGDATALTLKMLVGDPGSNAFAEVYDVGADGAAVLDEISVALAASKKITITVNTESMSRLQIAAKVDVATSDPALTLRVMGENEEV